MKIEACLRKAKTRFCTCAHGVIVVRCHNGNGMRRRSCCIRRSGGGGRSSMRGRGLGGLAVGGRGGWAARVDLGYGLLRHGCSRGCRGSRVGRGRGRGCHGRGIGSGIGWGRDVGQVRNEKVRVYGVGGARCSGGGSGCRGSSGEGKSVFIESDVPRDVNMTGHKIKTPVAFVFIRIT